jgi:hypothetical protein
MRWLVLLVATLATVATSPAPPPERVVRVIRAGTKMGAVTIRGFGDGVWTAYETKDDGLNWNELWRLEGEALDLVAATPVQRTAIDPRNPNRLFRIVSSEGSAPGLIEASQDGGQTWRTAWAPNTARLDFMARYRGNGPAGLPVEAGPHELAFTPDGEMLLAAAGTEGVLRMDPSGRWTRHAVGSAHPTP